jgi:hypothetical protein
MVLLQDASQGTEKENAVYYSQITGQHSNKELPSCKA